MRRMTMKNPKEKVARLKRPYQNEKHQVKKQLRFTKNKQKKARMKMMMS